MSRPSRYILLGFLLIFLFSSSIYPALVYSRSYQALSKMETAGIFQTIRPLLQKQLVLSFSDPSSSPTEEGAIGMTAYAAEHKVIQFYFKEIPAQLSRKIILETVKLGYQLLDSPNLAYTFLDTLEKLSVKEANQIALEWLTQNNIKAAGGDIYFPYTSYKGEKESGHFQYIILYHPQPDQSAKVIVAFYSPDFITPIDARGYIPWPYQAWRQEGHDQLSPFIVEIEGLVRKHYSTYDWTDQPNISVHFPSFVPRFFFTQNTATILHPLSWLKTQWAQLLSPSPTPKEITITPQSPSSSEMEDLRKTVLSLKEIVSQQSLDKQAASKKEGAENDETLALIKSFQELTRLSLQREQENTKVLKQISQIVQSQAEITKLQTQQLNSSAKVEKAQETKIADSQSSSQSDTALCSTEDLPQPAWETIVFNEIAWMGNQKSPSDEWLELKNISSQPVDLANWQIFNKNQRLVIHFNQDDQISPGQTFLLERGDDQTVPFQKADKIYQGGVKNSNESLYLFNDHCELQDLVEATPDWPAGDSSSRRTMERKNNLEWQTSSQTGGTPKQENSQGYQAPSVSSPVISSSSNTSNQSSETYSPPTDDYPPVADAGPDQTVDFDQAVTLDASQSGDNVGIVSYKWDTNDDGLWNIVKEDPLLTLEKGSFAPGEHLITLQVSDAAGHSSEDQVTVTVLEIPQILISEIQTEGENSQDEFIELFNPNQRDVSLTDWSLKKKTASGTEMNLVSSKNFKGIIPPQGYFLITPAVSDASHGYQGIATPDLYYSSSSNSLADNNTVLLYNPLGQLADKIGFGQEISDFEGQAYPENPETSFSLGRKWNEENQTYQDTNNNQEDFEIGLPTPKAQNQPYQKPSLTSVNFSLADPQSGSQTYTTQTTVNVVINNDEEATAWLISETQTESPDPDSSSWLTTKPQQFTLSAGDGEKTVFLWLKDQKGTISPQHTYSITLDENPPATVLDLSLYPTKENGQILLTWTAPGEPGSQAPSQYVIKQSQELITEDKWPEAELVSQNLSPQEPGETESFIVSGLDSSQTYYFAIKSQDEWGVLSPISNSPARQAIAAKGTEEDPYIITNCLELQDVSLNLNSFYQLAHSIDCSATIDWNNGLGFDPLGNNTTAFTGFLDGHDYTIDNLHINRTTQSDWNIGLIGKAKAGAKILNLGLRNADIRGYQDVGGLIGWANGSKNTPPIEITNCYTTGSLASSCTNSGGGLVGGLIGSASNTQIYHSWSSMQIDAPAADFVGGLIGSINIQTKVEDSYAKGKITGHQKVGGLIGQVGRETSVKRCWSQGEVKGDISGGLIGENDGSIENSYAQTEVSVTGSSSGGGFAAYGISSGSITNCYATGYVTGASKAGFSQSPYSTSVKDCYWDINSSGQASSGRGTGLTTAQMKDASSFPNWDFNTIWQIESGSYPTLRE